MKRRNRQEERARKRRDAVEELHPDLVNRPYGHDPGEGARGSSD